MSRKLDHTYKGVETEPNAIRDIRKHRKNIQEMMSKFKEKDWPKK